MTSAVVITVSDRLQYEAFYANLHHFAQCQIFIVCYDKHGQALDFSTHKIKQQCAEFGLDAHVSKLTTADRNEALNTVINSIEVDDFDYLFVLDQSVVVGGPFVEEMTSCFTPTKTTGANDIVYSDMSNISMVGPCLSGHNVPQAQFVQLSQLDIQSGLENYCQRRVSHFSKQVSLASILDGRFVCIKTALIKKLCENSVLLDTSLGSYAWNDLAARMHKNGQICAVSEAAFALINETDFTQDSLIEKIKYFSKHEADVQPKACVLYRACLRSFQDIQIFKASILKSAKVFDQMVVVLVNNPSDINFDFEYLKAKQHLSRQDNELITKCTDANRETVQRVVAKWVSMYVTQCRKDLKLAKMDIDLVVADQSTYQSSQINIGINIVERLGADGMFILDHDELIDDQATSEEIKRLLKHPSPQISAFDFQVVYHWDSPTLVRSEEPFGSSAEYKGGPSSVRLFRSTASRFPRCHAIASGLTTVPTPSIAADAVCVSFLRVRLLSLTRSVDRLRAGMTSSEEHISVSAYQHNTSMGLHMLAYEKEDPRDIQQWLNNVYGLAKSAVIVWTGAWLDADKSWLSDNALLGTTSLSTGPSNELSILSVVYSAQIIHCPLNDNIAEARNAGIDFLSSKKDLRWAMFIDPDEWFANLFEDCKSVRSMLSSDRCGFLFRVANYRANEEVPTVSDSIRISRLDASLSMRMTGRVHESFDKSIKLIQEKGLHPRLTYAPFILQHRGMAFDPKTMDEKLTKYERLLRLELADDCNNPGAWVGLGWHYLNDGYNEQGYQCYLNALECSGTSYLPYKEMAFYKLREARALIQQCDKLLSPAHGFYDLCSSMNKWLQEHAPEHPIIDRGKDIELVELPEFKVE